jgi:hypothetical protein
MIARSLTPLVLMAAIGSASPARADERIDERSEAPPLAPPGASKGGVPTSWIVVGAGVLMVFAAIPLIVQADMRVRRDDGVSFGRRQGGCDNATLCSVLASTDTDAVPYWVAAGVTAGLGIATITTGAVLHWKVPSTRGEPTIGLEPRPGGAVAGLRMKF